MEEILIEIRIQEEETVLTQLTTYRVPRKGDFIELDEIYKVSYVIWKTNKERNDFLYVLVYVKL